MNRREFLFLVGGLSAATVVSCSPVGKFLGRPIETPLGDQRYRGTPDGQVFISSDQGEHWELHTNFGPDFSILDLRANSSGNLHAELSYKGNSFVLSLEPHGAIWRTV